MSQLNEKRRLLYWKLWRTISPAQRAALLCCALIACTHKN
ncbi:putative lipoprotein [Klebsiella sp. OBRC7]|nr:putative lipoprotein [Klebsiella sp. OBRC7]